MTTFDQTTELPVVRPTRRRVQGLKMPALPSNPLLAQLAGGASALGGVYLAWGVPATMIIGGVVAAVLGALREAGKV
jgi:hypothetical protein